MNDQDDFRDFDSLLSKLIDSGLEERELHELSLAIASNPCARQRYLEVCQIHGLLRAEHGLMASLGVRDGPMSAALPPSPSKPRSRIRTLALWCAAAMLLAAVSIGIWTTVDAPQSVAVEAPKPDRGKVVARLVRHVRAHFAYGPSGESIPATNVGMPQGTYELQTGIIELESTSGVLLTVEAPADFTLVDDQRIRVDNGRIAAHVPERAVGFRVETASATVVDLGTDFAVEAIPGAKSEVHVFNGEVQIKLHGSKATSATPLHLATGEAARIDFLTGMPSGIDLDEQRFLRRLDTEPHAYTRRILDLQPAVYYPMEPAGDATYLEDFGPEGAAATINFGRATQSVWAAGKIGLAFALGGPSQQTYASADYYPQAVGDQLSVVAWVSASTRPRWASIAKNWAGADDRGQFHFGLHFDSGELEAHIEDSSGQEIVVKDTIPLPLHTWHHVAFVADGQTLRLYRNGREVAATAYRELHRDLRIKALAIGTKLNLRGDAPDHQDFNMWDGRLDELAIFNAALSPEEIRELYELGSMDQ
jgi:ferric-dicitrate binding protein FerR (iron transport regulator)